MNQSWIRALFGGAVCCAVACSSDGAAPAAAGDGGGTGGNASGGNVAASGGNGAASGGNAGSAGAIGGGGAGASAGGAAGGRGNGGSSTGGTAGTQSERTACIAYVEAACQRLWECNGRTLSTCLALREQCPDYMFSPGTRRTAASLAACAAEWATFPCGLALNGASPACAARGSRSEGEPCLYQHQCSTGLCSVNGGSTCGSCGAPSSPLGGPCGRLTQACDVGLVCQVDRCTTPPDAPAQLLAPMAVCRTGDTAPGLCPPQHLCHQPAGATVYQCHPLPPAGQPCMQFQCAEGAYCSQRDRCEVLPAIGESCAYLSQLATGPRCAPDAFCSGAGCVPRKPAGAACDLPHDEQCAPGNRCFAEGAVSGTGTCTPFPVEGESCSNPAARCEQGTTCTGGVCRSSGLLGTFAAACE